MSVLLAAGTLYVAVIWHQHEPLYPKRPGENVYTQPWVRLHATRDYLRMAETAAREPRVKVTINLSPTLLEQLADLAAGATDRAMVLSSIDARILNAGQKREIHRTFFAAGPELRKPLPRYSALAALPEPRYTVRDWRDLQVCFNLAWLAPEAQREPAIAALIRKGRDFTENEKLLVLRRHHELVREVIPAHARLARAGRLELTTTPYAHPILPLLVDTDVAAGNLRPGDRLPARFAHPEDAAEHVRLAVAAHKRHFGQAPRGMWPAEGAVSQAIMPLLRKSGIAWVASDERILEATLGTPLRSGQAMARPDLLARLWRAQDGPSLVFRDRELSDRIAAAYPAWQPRKAADDLLARLGAIGRRLPAGKPAMVAIALDGAKTWERYPDAGEGFMTAFYAGLGRAAGLRALSPGDVLARHPSTSLPGPLAAGSQVDGTFAAWIGEPAENAAWDLLRAARAAVAAYAAKQGRTPAHEAAMSALRVAQGSDWFRCYGADHECGRDAQFDAAFRGRLADAYRAIGREAPEAVRRPAGIPAPVAAWRPFTPPLDGRGGAAWAGAIAATQAAGARQGARAFRHVQVGADGTNLYLAADFADRPAGTSVLLGFPARPGGVARHGVAFPVHAMVDLQPHGSPSIQILGDPPATRPVLAAWSDTRLEAAVPWSVLGARGGEDLAVSFLELGATPYPDLPVHLPVPRLGDRQVVAFGDPAGDGPGADIVRFAVEDDDIDWVFVWTLASLPAGPDRPGLGKIRLEAYLATEPGNPDPEGVALLPGRAAPRATLPWRIALVADGTRPGYFAPPGAGLPTKARLVLNPENRTVSLHVPKRALPGAPRRWNVLAGAVGPDGLFSDLVGLPTGIATADFLSPE
ncbi:MAG: hypothetical protein FJZ01_25545 [Candidatus Sericytochromatia bacterium]|nr:hypothetical protein [Candidatus Tanganyikabacteria bacterium]